jgi:hypothetical protein
MVLNATFNNISVISWLSVLLIFIFIFYFWCFNATFSNIPAISWRPVLVGGRRRNTWRQPPTMDKQLVNFITCESSAPFLYVTKPDANPRRIGDRLA